MYASLSWQIVPGPPLAGALDAQVLGLLTGRPHTRLLERTVVCDLTDTQDYIDLAHSLRTLADQHPGALFFVCFAHARNSPMRHRLPPTTDATIAQGIVRDVVLA